MIHCVDSLLKIELCGGFSDSREILEEVGTSETEDNR